MTHRFDLEAVDAAFAALTAPDTDAVKILVQPGGTRAGDEHALNGHGLVDRVVELLGLAAAGW